MAAALIARQKVADYENWKAVYDGVWPLCERYEMTGRNVYRDVEDPDTVVVVMEFDDADKANAFARCQELKATRKEAGAVGEFPEMWIS